MDDQTFVDGITRWLAHHRGVDRVVVDELSRPTAGYSSLTILLRARWERDAHVVEHLVVRMAPAGSGLFPDYDLVAQNAAQRAAAAANVPIPAPLVVETDPSWLGAPFMVMARVDGHIVGDAPAFDPWLAALDIEDQALVHDRFLQTLGAIHEGSIDDAVGGGVALRDAAAELRYWREYLHWSSDDAPLTVLVDALDWCAEQAPMEAAASDLVLCWGDVRLGNAVFGDDLHVRAVLDWDMAVVGAPEHDVAWLTMLDTLMTTLSDRRVPGFLDRDGTISRYEGLTGRRLRSFDWYETFALSRSSAIMTRVARLQRLSGRDAMLNPEDNPVLDLLRERITRP